MLMLARKFANYRLHIGGTTQNKQELQTAYWRDNTKQAEMLYFHCGPSPQGRKKN